MRSIRRDEGATSTGYALLVTFVAIAVAAVVAGLGDSVLALFTSANTTIPWGG